MTKFTEDYAKAKSIWDCTEYLPLSDSEITSLQASGNSADDWTLLYKFKNTSSSTFTNRIMKCRFKGRVVFSTFSKTVEVHGISYSTGCYSSTLSNVILEEDCLVDTCHLVSNTFVRSYAILWNVGSIRCSSQTSFSNGLNVPVGVETGGRALTIHADLTLEEAVSLCTNHSKKHFVENVTSSFNVIEHHAHLIQSTYLDKIYIGPYANIGICTLQEVTILSNQNEVSSIAGNAHVLKSIVQWNCTVDSMAIVSGSMMADSSSVTCHGKLLSSYLGPNSGIAEGECTSSFVGPFVGFHHQALLIATFWPTGKGNIGYGANVGSNHTLKAPDQECWPSEGMFFGLGCNVKFPAHFKNAPYSVIATGVTTLPQYMSFPFSLINTPSGLFPGLSPAINEIFPGWVLHSSVFTVLRNEHKFTTRSKSVRTFIPSRILRPVIVNDMLNARTALERVSTVQDVYTDRNIPGLGKNFLVEKNRVKGIAAYTFFIAHYSYQEAITCLQKGVTMLELIPVLKRNALLKTLFALEEMKQPVNVSDFLQKIILSYQIVADSAASGKVRDDKRGARIMPDYAEVHIPVEEESVVVAARERAREVRMVVEGALAVSARESKL